MDYRYVNPPLSKNTLENLLDELSYQTSIAGETPNMKELIIKKEILRRFRKLENRAKGVSFALDRLSDAVTKIVRRQS